MSIYIVAEIGINHNGNVEIVKQLIEMAKKSGCNAVKFQKRDIDLVYSNEVLDTPRESPFGTTTRDQKKGLEFSLDQYSEIDSFCKQTRIDWFASSWDINSQVQMRQFDFPHNKVASALITNSEFLELVASEKRHTFISTGMSEMNDIENAVTIFQNYNCPITLMHTVSLYPCPEDQLNLNMITTLKSRFNVPVGYSGHEISPYPSIATVALGVSAIERHITLDRSMYGTDQSASLERRGLEILVNGVRSIELAMGDGIKKFSKSEKEVSKKLRYWEI